MTGKVVIFLDLDGVIADFEKHAHDHGKMKPSGTPDWDSLDREWWTTIPMFKGAKDFCRELKKAAPVKFLTAPTLSPDCFGGKAEWIKNNFGKWALRDLIICSGDDKELLAGPGRILIDDRLKNVMAWQQAGGIGILHQGDFERTLARTKDVLCNFSAPSSDQHHNQSPTAPLKPSQS